jgi:choline dehydrogenase
MMASHSADYVIIGAGTAGSVLANRLSADPSVSVLLIEAGARDTHPMIHIPAGFVRLLDHQNVTWKYKTKPEAESGGRAILFPRGRVLGGSSSINGLLYVRPFEEDMDEWARLVGDTSWKYKNVLPFYCKSETWRGGQSPVRGKDGYIQVSRIQEPPEVCHAAIAAGKEAGLTFVEDPNQAHSASSVWYYQQTRDGRFRSSAARAYLYPARDRKNLTILTEGQVESLLIEGDVCRGVVMRSAAGQKEVLANREVILSAGVIGSPQILQLSGIGPSDVMDELNIPMTLQSEGVGRNFQDHYVARLSYRLKDTVTANERSRGVRLLNELLAYAISGKGILTYSAALVGAFYRTKYGERPDVQYVIAPGSFQEGRIGQLEKNPGMSLGCWQMRPKSRGRIRIVSQDPLVAPDIAAGYLSDPEDAKVLVEGLKFGRSLFTNPSLRKYVVEETVPGIDHTSDRDLLAYVRRNGSTVYHAVGTCAMGTDEMAVVDSELKVRGIRRLRVVDASIMPRVTSTNTNATVLMIAEKAASMILAESDRK